ncbi:MAG: alpha/beta fold hydrolase [Fimbriimonadales bacterium]|nr:alpha/beta fold hydrolase [Fimbriimonadales bacterium]
MSTIRLILAIAVITCSGCAQVTKGAEPKPESKPNPFAYDGRAALEPIVGEPARKSGYLEYKFSILGADGRVPGVLTVPRDINEKPPVILLLHGMGGKKEDLTAVAAMAAAAGYATVAIDAPMHGERAVSGKAILDPDPIVTRKHWVQAIVDWRRTIDFLETRTDVDSNRIVLLGASMGGMMGSLLAGTDERVDAAALLIAGGDWKALFRESEHDSIRVLDGQDPAAVEALVDRHMKDIDPVEWVGRISPRPVLFVNGTKDTIIPKASAEALINAAKEPKEVIWDPVAHTISPLRLPTILDWIKTHTPKS